MIAFFDTNILVYAQQEGEKAEISQDLIERGGRISAQVLNEMANVLGKKSGRNWDEIALALADIERALEPVSPLTAKTTVGALVLARDHGLAFYDALIVASAIEDGCDTLYSEDMQHGRRFGRLVIVNPFLPGTP
ncbi:MAG: PIN domain-containing protein [Bradyrhizobium sp.]|nr:PIN domain-containing protein [Bradyrhizobium sp.]